MVESGAQSLRELYQRSRPEVEVESPVAMVELLEKKLAGQFVVHSRLAGAVTGTLLDGRIVVSNASLVNGRDERFSYLVFPADLLEGRPFTIHTRDGRILERPPAAEVHVLSREDNLALVRLDRQARALTFRYGGSAEVGEFIGMVAARSPWHTGVITNGKRTALHSTDPGMLKALERHWERIGLVVSEKRSGFPEVIETDLTIIPREAGAPVFDREGNWRGIAIARADQHSTFVIPADRVARLISDFERVFP